MLILEIAAYGIVQYVGRRVIGVLMETVGASVIKEISRIIASLKCKNSSGHDGISSKLLKSLQPALCLPISILINKSMETGQVPANMKIAKIMPIYKSKEKNNMGNYRPISLLPSVSKILEKAVHKRLYGFCETQNILYDNQYGFRPKHSNIDAVSKLSRHLLKTTSTHFQGI